MEDADDLDVGLQRGDQRAAAGVAEEQSRVTPVGIKVGRRRKLVGNVV